MAKKRQDKIKPKININVRQKADSPPSRGRVKVKFVILALVLAFTGAGLSFNVGTEAAKCPDVRFVFARGSGSERWTDQNYKAFEHEIEAKITGLGLKYEFIDLDYPAISIDDVSVIAGAFFGAGESYEFGRSVDTGVDQLVQMVNRDKCSKTKYVLGGYSQGAMVVSKALHSLNADKIIYAATFGDPKLFLPEGKSWFSMGFGSSSGKNFMRTGTIPAACKNENLSEYRMYVPDCYAYEGLLGSYQPYQPAKFTGKLGTWCNKGDVFCSSYFNISDHTAYVSDGLYEDASRVVYDKIAAMFGREKEYTSPHDTVILIDSTGSMGHLIDQYKEEALNLAEKTFRIGGRVALFDYRDLGDPYEPTMHCDFKTCNLESFKAGLAEIEVDGGGDMPESLLSASYNIMNRLDWTYGATKSIVVLTDADYHDPDLDGVKFEDVVKLSREIDPVNFYVITVDEITGAYTELVSETDGRVIKISDDLSELTGHIMGRYDSLPRVMPDVIPADLPIVEIADFVDNGESVEIKLRGDMVNTMVSLNDAVLGISDENEIVINGLDRSRTNEIRVTALSDARRGNSDTLILGTISDTSIPLAPNTGKS